MLLLLLLSPLSNFQFESNSNLNFGRTGFLFHFLVPLSITWNLHFFFLCFLSEIFAAAKNKFNSNNHYGKFRIALDIEDCLDRFYGGYYSGNKWISSIFCSWFALCFVLMKVQKFRFDLFRLGLWRPMESCLSICAAASRCIQCGAHWADCIFRWYTQGE